MTLSEVIVVITIVGILAIMAIMSLKPSVQIAKANDSRRKADLKKISTGLEDYLGDHPCYPPNIYEGNTGCVPSVEIKPYLRNIPCDPQTGAHYVYVRPNDCSQYVIYATLTQQTDNDYGRGNYAITSSNLRVVPQVTSLPTIPLTQPVPTSTSIPIPTSTQSPISTGTPEGGPWACYSGECDVYRGPCVDPIYPNDYCYTSCTNPDNECNK